MKKWTAGLAVLCAARPAIMGKMSFQKQSKMSVHEKRLRDAEAEAVLSFLEKWPPTFENTLKSVRFVKIKDVSPSFTHVKAEAATELDAASIERYDAEMKAALAASKLQAAVGAADQRKKAALEAELARIRAGQRPTLAAMLRGDLELLQALYGPYVAMIARAMAALKRKRRAIKAVEMRRAEVEAAKAARAANAAIGVRPSTDPTDTEKINETK